MSVHDLDSLASSTDSTYLSKTNSKFNVNSNAILLATNIPSKFQEFKYSLGNKFNNISITYLFYLYF